MPEFPEGYPMWCLRFTDLGRRSLCSIGPTDKGKVHPRRSTGNLLVAHKWADTADYIPDRLVCKDRSDRLVDEDSKARLFVDFSNYRVSERLSRFDTSCGYF